MSVPVLCPLQSQSKLFSISFYSLFLLWLIFFILPVRTKPSQIGGQMFFNETKPYVRKQTRLPVLPKRPVSSACRCVTAGVLNLDSSSWRQYPIAFDSRHKSAAVATAEAGQEVGNDGDTRDGFATRLYWQTRSRTTHEWPTDFEQCQ